MFVGGKMIEEDQTKKELEARLVESENMIRHYESVVRNRDQELNITKRVSKPTVTSEYECDVTRLAWGYCSNLGKVIELLLWTSHRQGAFITYLYSLLNIILGIFILCHVGIFYSLYDI